MQHKEHGIQWTVGRAFPQSGGKFAPVTIKNIISDDSTGVCRRSQSGNNIPPKLCSSLQDTAQRRTVAADGQHVRPAQYSEVLPGCFAVQKCMSFMKQSGNENSWSKQIQLLWQNGSGVREAVGTKASGGKLGMV